MTQSAPLIITAAVRSSLIALREKAARAPVDIRALMREIKTADGKATHVAQMIAQTVEIPGAPWSFFVTFSVETGHKAGTCRHMSMSVSREGRLPHPAGVWMVAKELGFAGGLLDACAVWPEDLGDAGVAINVAQPIAVRDAAGAAS